MDDELKIKIKQKMTLYCTPGIIHKCNNKQNQAKMTLP